MAAAAVGTTIKTVGRLMWATGGLPPRGRDRSALRLSVAEREGISRALLAGTSLRAIATGLGRAPSTISGEVARIFAPAELESIDELISLLGGAPNAIEELAQPGIQVELVPTDHSTT